MPIAPAAQYCLLFTSNFTNMPRELLFGFMGLYLRPYQEADLAGYIAGQCGNCPGAGWLIPRRRSG